MLKLLLGLLLLLMAMPPTSVVAREDSFGKIKKKLATEKARAAQIERQLRGKQQTLKKVTKQQMCAQRELDTLAAKLQAQETRLAGINSRLAATETSLRRTESELAELLPRIRSLREGCRDRLQTMAGLEPGNDPEAIFAPGHVSQDVIDALLLERLAQAEARTAQGFSRDAERLKAAQDKLARERKELEGLKADQAEEQARIEATRQEQAKMLASLGRQKQAVTRDATNLERSRDSLHSLIDSLETKFEAERAARERVVRERAAREKASRERAARDKASRDKLAREKAQRERIETGHKAEIQTEPKAQPKVQASISRAPAQRIAPEPPVYEAQPGTGFAALKGRLPLPVAGRVVATFGKRDGYGLICTGIDITARGGETVRAVSSGTVAYAGLLKGYGKLIIIDHGDGWYSLYGRAARLSAAAGERVRGGQILGTLADGAEGLYFEIRHHRKPQNPLAWLAGASSN